MEGRAGARVSAPERACAEVLESVVSIVLYLRGENTIATDREKPALRVFPSRLSVQGEGRSDLLLGPDAGGERNGGSADQDTLREWAYRFAYPTSSPTAPSAPRLPQVVQPRKTHGLLGARPPISRVSHVCGRYG